MDIKTYKAESYDVAVIGGGHAGIEASLAAARLNCKTVMFTISLDWVGNMPCNPSIGGTAKGHLVREIDALGGEMGKAADKNTLQSRMLNLGKGPAVHSLRAQIDRRNYSGYMKHTVEKQKNLDVKQAEIVSVERRLALHNQARRRLLLFRSNSGDRHIFGRPRLRRRSELCKRTRRQLPCHVSFRVA